MDIEVQISAVVALRRLVVWQNLHCYCRLRVLLPLHFSSYLRELCCMQLLTFTNSFLC